MTSQLPPGAPDAPPEPRRLPRFTVREAIALVLIGAFLLAFFLDPTPEMRGALITAFTGAVAYYLGSSHGAHENREQLNRLAERASAPPPAAGDRP